MGDSKPKLRFDSFEVDPGAGELRNAGTRIRIQDQPFKILVLLLEHAQEVVTREQLKAHIWPEDSFGDFDHGVNAAIAKLRIALGDSADNPRYVETIPRRGYRFLVTVEGSVPRPSAIKPPLAASVEPPSAHSGRGLYWGLAAVCIAAIAIAVVLLRGKPSAQTVAYLQNAKMTRMTTDGNVGSIAMSPDGQYIAFATIRNGKASLRVRQLSGANSVEIASSDVEYQNLLYAPDGNAIFYRQFDQTGQGLVFQIPALGGVARRVSADVDSAVTVSPDGKQVAFIRHNPPLEMSELIVGMTDGSGEKVLIQTKYPEVLDSPSWSRDGARLACSFRKALLGNVFDLVEVDVATGKQSAPLLHNWHGIGQIAWTMHSEGLIFIALDERGFGRGQLFYLPYPNGPPRKITSGVDIYDGISISADSQRLATVLERLDSDVWLAAAYDLDHPRRFTTGQGNSSGALGLAYGRNGKIIFSSQANGTGTLWIGSREDGTSQQLIPQAGDDFAPWVMPDGSIVFTSPRVTGKFCLWHVDRDGTNPRQLTSGDDDRFPVSTPDGRWIFYQSSAKGQSLIMKIPIGGGQPERVSDILSGPPAISPDGKLLAYMISQRDGFKVAVQPVDRCGPRILLNSLPLLGAAVDNIAWDRNGKSVQYFSEVGGVSNLWSQSISGGRPKQLTHFSSGHIFAFAWSPDYKELALAKGDVTRNVITIDEQK